MKAKKAQPGSEVSAKCMRAMKRASQARNRELVASGGVPPEAVFLVRPDKLQNARIEWPRGSLLDEEELPHQPERKTGKT